MDALARGRRVLLIGLAGGLSLTAPGCQRDALGPVGLSTPRAEGTQARALDAGAPAALGDVLASLTQVTPRQALGGHGAVFDGAVWANPGARDAWAAGRPMPEGARLVEQVFTHAGGDPAGAFVMDRTAGGWSYAAVGPQGEASPPAQTVLCKVCHVAAPADEVFFVRAPGGAPADAAADVTPAAPR